MGRLALSRLVLCFATTLACLCSAVANAQLTFTADPIAGKVVDEESGEPLAGVVIVALWLIEESFVGRANGVLNILETTSDRNGDYGFPGWGPKVVPPSPFPVFGSGKDPLVLYFKEGYWPAREKNDSIYYARLHTRQPPLGGFKANGLTIKLRKWDGTDEERYYSELTSMLIGLRGAWQSYPRLTISMDRIYRLLVRRMGQKELRNTFPVPSIKGFPHGNWKGLSDAELGILRQIGD